MGGAQNGSGHAPIGVPWFFSSGLQSERFEDGGQPCLQDSEGWMLHKSGKDRSLYLVGGIRYVGCWTCFVPHTGRNQQGPVSKMEEPEMPQRSESLKKRASVVFHVYTSYHGVPNVRNFLVKFPPGLKHAALEDEHRR